MHRIAVPRAGGRRRASGRREARSGVGARQRASWSYSPRLFERSERRSRSELRGATPAPSIAAQSARSADRHSEATTVARLAARPHAFVNDLAAACLEAETQ